MTSLADTQLLLRLCASRQQRCDNTLRQIRQQLNAVEGEYRDIATQEQSLLGYIASQHADGSALSHEQLLMLLRRQAASRRQLLNLVLDRTRIDEQRAALLEQLQAGQQERRQLLRRQGKYQTLHQRLVSAQRLDRLRREDNESEDIRCRSPAVTDQEA
ncbi:hypothetical protein ACIPL1_02535 [Pseudomonas sp. NPDC090202]|uniref:hypothetical protein n=1 Tax=unclassified Pseudomonas TaxID=196821 RepID=UPI0037F15877